MPEPWEEPKSESEAKERIRGWIMDYAQRESMSQVQLAEDLGVSEPTISNIFTGKVKPGFKILIRLHFRLGAPLNEVLRFRDRAGTTRAHEPKGGVRK